jgi:hypothetical protein
VRAFGVEFVDEPVEAAPWLEGVHAGREREDVFRMFGRANIDLLKARLVATS